MAYEQQSVQDRSLGELFSDLVREVTTLVRQEITLAKTEMSQKAAEAGKNVGALAVGGAVAYAGLLAIIAAIILIMIHAGMAPWLSALLVGIIVAGVGAALVMKGLNALKTMDMAPKQTVETLKEDTQWAKEQMR